MENLKPEFIFHLLFVREQAGKAEEAITLYLSLFKDSRISHIERWGEGEDDIETPGTIKLVRFSLAGQEFQAQDSRRMHAFTFTPALSIFVHAKRSQRSMRYFKSFLRAAQSSCHSINIRSARSLVGSGTDMGFHGN